GGCVVGLGNEQPPAPWDHPPPAPQPNPAGRARRLNVDPNCPLHRSPPAISSAASGVQVIDAEGEVSSRCGHLRPLLFHSSSASRFTAGAFAFFILSQSGERLLTYGESRRFDTIPSQPSLQAWRVAS